MTNWRLEMEKRILPIQIRPDLFVRILDIPWDLTQAEADKIVAVVQAMSLGKSPTDTAPPACGNEGRMSG